VVVEGSGAKGPGAVDEGWGGEAGLRNFARSTSRLEAVEHDARGGCAEVDGREFISNAG